LFHNLQHMKFSDLLWKR